MRTTVSISDELLAAAKRRARERGQTLGEVVDAALRRELAAAADRVYLLDVNVVLAAHRGDHPHHQPVRAWFDETVAGDEPFAVPDLVWASFLRLATNRRIFEVP